MSQPYKQDHRPDDQTPLGEAARPCGSEHAPTEVRVSGRTADFVFGRIEPAVLIRKRKRLH